MNKTKRKIFETSMELFAKKGYEATSIEEITSIVGVAKGTLYYHFSSKEEIFNFLVEEGIKLLKNSIEIKTAKLKNSIDKLKAVVLIQIKIIAKYEDFISILLSELWRQEPRNKNCRRYAFEYIDVIENIISEGMKNNEIIEGDSNVIAHGIFGFTCSTMFYKLSQNKEIDIQKIYKELTKDFINNLEYNHI